MIPQDDDEETRSGTYDTPAPAARNERLVYADRYHVERLLGKGGMGEVFLVRDAQTGTAAALKVLNASEDDDDRVERFKREIGVLSRINHAAVPRILDWGVDRGRVFFVSELVDGHDLRTEIKRRSAFATADAVALVTTVADVLSAAHAAGVVHRDVKPSNIMIARDGTVRLLDFGLARTTGVDTTTLTKTGMIVGTPTYMSPEQFDNTWVDERSDIYSLGVVLFELLTGRPPFSAGTVIGVAMMHKNDLPPSTQTIREDVPGWPAVDVSVHSPAADRSDPHAHRLPRRLRGAKQTQNKFQVSSLKTLWNQVLILVTCYLPSTRRNPMQPSCARGSMP